MPLLDIPGVCTDRTTTKLLMVAAGQYQFQYSITQLQLTADTVYTRAINRVNLEYPRINYDKFPAPGR